MIKTVEATIDSQGIVELSAPIQLDGNHRALVMILDERPSGSPSKSPQTRSPSTEKVDFAEESALLSEACLAKDWNRTEEDKAWAHMQDRTSS